MVYISFDLYMITLYNLVIGEWQDYSYNILGYTNFRSFSIIPITVMSLANSVRSCLNSFIMSVISFI